MLTKAQVPNATMAELVATYNAMPTTKRKVKKFETITIARARVSAALREAPEATKPTKPTKPAKPAKKSRVALVDRVVLFTEPTVKRRPQPGSKRSAVREALKKLRRATVGRLSDELNFDTRGYVLKLVALGWARFEE